MSFNRSKLQGTIRTETQGGAHAAVQVCPGSSQSFKWMMLAHTTCFLQRCQSHPNTTTKASNQMLDQLSVLVQPR